MGDNVQLMEEMATRGRENRDSFINSAKQLYRDVTGIGNPDAEYYKESMKTPEGIKQYFMDFTSIEEDPRTKDYAESAPAYEGFRGGGGVGSLNETARNMFRGYEDGGDVSPVPRGEDINLEEIRKEMADRFGDTASQYGNENLKKGIGFFRSAGKDFPEGGGAHYIRQGADYLSDIGKAGIYSLAGVGEKGVALGAEVIDNIASYLFNTAGEEKLANDMIGMISETPVFGQLIGKASQVSRLTGPSSVVKNTNPGAFKGQLFEELSDAEKLQRKANVLKDSRRNTIREVDDTVARRFRKPPDSSRMQSGADPFEIIKYIRRQAKLSEIDMLERNLRDVGRSADEIEKNIKMQTLIRDLQKMDIENKAGGGMVGIGAYEQYMV